MVTQLTARAGLWLDGVAAAANDLRLQVAAAMLTASAATATTGIAATPGVRQGVGTPLLSTWTSGMSFTLNAGTCFVQGTASGTAGLYEATLDTTGTMTCTTSDPTNPRIDSVVAVISDVGSSSSTTLFKILAGTPAPSPVAPTLPANALLLCNIAVGANVSVLSAPNFTDKRVYTVCSGGMLPYGNVAGASIAGPAGSPVLDMATGRWKSLDGAGNAIQPKIGAFAAVTVSNSANVTAPLAAYGTILSTSVTTDGATEIEIYAQWNGQYISSTGTVGDYISLAAAVDGAFIQPYPIISEFTTTIVSNPQQGGSLRAWTTPAAGTHTVTLQARSRSNGANPFLVANSSLRVMPSQQQ